MAWLVDTLAVYAIVGVVVSLFLALIIVEARRSRPGTGSPGGGGRTRRRSHLEVDGEDDRTRR